MTISVKIICDSVWDGVRLTTFELKYPRIIHSEFMTHRDFSRNASSSRAIPVNKIIKEIVKNPAKPSAWGQNQKGMQAGRELSGISRWLTQHSWMMARYPAVGFAKIMVSAGAHKQIVNRILEPWSHISVVVSSTRWENFFALRCDENADPTIQELALKMQMRYNNQSVPVERHEHLPYLRDNVFDQVAGYQETRHPDRFKISAARCARVSYLNHDGTNPTIKQDLALYDRLMAGKLKHASPTEHQGFVILDHHASDFKVSENANGNFHGPWKQFRKMIEGEYVY